MGVFIKFLPLGKKSKLNKFMETKSFRVVGSIPGERFRFTPGNVVRPFIPGLCRKCFPETHEKGIIVKPAFIFMAELFKLRWELGIGKVAECLYKQAVLVLRYLLVVNGEIGKIRRIRQIFFGEERILYERFQVDQKGITCKY